MAQIKWTHPPVPTEGRHSKFHR
uniref:Uncharacterized protein n=1 Tax=Rhizophora mucronata TaxID=61149 RepID=A0A2P2P9A0_RHIMU